ncbi:MAG: 30S ribosomal protein S1 [Bdellovibrionales bacterium]|nr:30S ribosomal protein S1 [Bdellovibrionales bacterium]
MNEVKNGMKKTKEEVLVALDALDKNFSEDSGLLSNKEESKEFENFFNKQMYKRVFKPGQIIQGEIIKVTDDYVFVDINYKSEGKIPISEFSHFNLDTQEEMKKGEKVDVYIEKIEDKNGLVVLSKDKANIKKVWQNIIKAYENNEVIKGKVIATVKGGLTVDVGIKAFLPGSQFDIRPVRNLADYVGQTLEFKIIKISHKRGNLVLSRRFVLEKDKENLTVIDKVKEGDVVEGIVKNITSYGAFVDLGNRDGLLHITDMSWSRIEHPNEILKLGQKLKLKVLKFDSEKNRVSLGLKQMSEEKWKAGISKYELGQILKVKISSIVDYGVFVQLDEEIDGLIHFNELSWKRRHNISSEMFKVGDEVDAKIIDIKPDKRKLSLSIKQTRISPWLSIKDLYKKDQEGEFEITSISDFGIFVKITDELDGLIRFGDLSWSKNINPSAKYKIGDKVKAKVLDIDVEGEKFSLGIKQLEEDPWKKLEKEFPIGSQHEVEVVKIVDFGVFVKLKYGIEGLIHVSELSKKRVNEISDVVKVGDKVKAEILNIDESAKKIGLSIRLVESNESKEISKEEVKGKNKTGMMENFFAKALKKSIKKTESQKES